MMDLEISHDIVNLVFNTLFESILAFQDRNLGEIYCKSFVEFLSIKISVWQALNMAHFLLKILIVLLG